MDKDGNTKRVGLKLFGKKKDDIATINYIDCKDVENWSVDDACDQKTDDNI